MVKGETKCPVGSMTYLLSAGPDLALRHDPRQPKSLYRDDFAALSLLLATVGDPGLGTKVDTESAGKLVRSLVVHRQD